MTESSSKERLTPEDAEKILLAMVGSWEGTNRTWFEPNKLADTSPIRGTIRQLPDSRYIIYEYQSSVEGEQFQGIALFGFNIFSGQFEMAWGDSGHQRTNLMFAVGQTVENGFSVLGSYMYDPEKPAWGWRTQLQRNGADELIVTMFNISPEGEEYKGIEAIYRRAGH